MYPQYWDNPNPDKILRAAQVWEPERNAHLNFQWQFDPEFSPWETFLITEEPYRLQDWKKWLLQEIEDQEAEERYCWDDLSLEHKIEEPIIFVTLSDKPIPEIWDGWHRTASCFLHNRKHLRAIIGRPIE